MTVKLIDAAVGSLLQVLGYHQETSYTARLQRLGLVPGTHIKLVRKAPLGDPLEISLRGYSLALRPSEASDLHLQIVGSNS